MWSLYLLVHVWLAGSVRLPCMALLYWAGRKWKRLHFLTRNRKCWLLIWGCLGLLETVVVAGLLSASYFPEFAPGFPGWAGQAAWTVLSSFHLYNVLVDFILGFLFAAIGETTIGVAFAALVWWIFGRYSGPSETPQTITRTHRYTIALLASACALGIANRIYSLRPPTCYDCFALHGIPFTYFHLQSQGGFLEV